MSTEYYIQSLEGGEAPGAEKSAVLAAFDTSDAEQKDGFYPLTYGAGTVCDLTISVAGDRVTGMCIHRPCDHDALYESIFAVLKLADYILFAPGGHAPIVARSHAAALASAELVEALGAPVLLADAARIPGALFG